MSKKKKKKKHAEQTEIVETAKEIKIPEQQAEKPIDEKSKKEKIIIKSIFTGENITSNTQEAMDLYGQSCFGEINEGKVYYSFVESLYLVEKKKLNVYLKNKKLTFDKLIEKIREIDKKISTKYAVFKDMRNRGFIVKTALKFGAEFRVYNRGVKPGGDHARWILYPVHESNDFTWHEFAAKNRVAHSTKKHLLIGIVDEENDVTYYEIRWIRP